MTNKRVGGALSATAMQALAGMRRAAAVDVLEDRPCRPTDRVDFLIEARRMIEAGATIADVAYALSLSTDMVGRLIGPSKEHHHVARTVERRLKRPRNGVESGAIVEVASAIDGDHQQQDRS